MSVIDNSDLWAMHDAEQAKELSRLPVCYECEEPIQSEHCYEINGELICPDYMEQNHRKQVEDCYE